ncbi:MAG: hypothetical protein P8Y05_07090 [Deinococcales bacterium]
MRTILPFLVVALVGGSALAAPTYFVMADMVRAEEGTPRGPVCVPNSVFFPGEKIVFRAGVVDAATGEQLRFDEVQARGDKAVVKFYDHDDIAMFFPPPEAGSPPGSGFFRGPWPVPQDQAAGMYNWHIEVSDAQGNSASYQPIGQSFGANAVTIQSAP